MPDRPLTDAMWRALRDARDGPVVWAERPGASPTAVLHTDLGSNPHGLGTLEALERRHLLLKDLGPASRSYQYLLTRQGARVLGIPEDGLMDWEPYPDA